MGAEIDQLYRQYSDELAITQLSDKPVLSNIEIDQLINTAVANIFKGENEAIPKELWKITNDTLQHSITEVFGLDYLPNPELVSKLRTNTSVFSAFKAHHNANAIRSLLVDQKGKSRTWSEYQPLAKKVSNQWQKQWLKTEYNTATARARTAHQFDKFQQTKDIYPNLRWTRSRSANPRERHLQLVGIIKPINDPFWNTNFPGNIWNCKCSIQRTAQEPTKPISRTAPSPAKGLDQNPKNGELFTASHPYFKVQDLEEIQQYFLKKPIKTNTDLNAFFSILDKKTNNQFFHKNFEALLTERNPRNNGSTNLKGTIWLKSDRIKSCKQAINNIIQKQTNNLIQEDALSTLWHEITHNRHKLDFKGFSKNKKLGEKQRSHMEVANEFVSRNTLDDFIKSMGGKLQHKSLITNRPSTGYNHWVRNYQHLIEVSGADKTKVLKDVQEHLFNQPYEEQVNGLKKAIANNSNMKLKSVEAEKLFDELLLSKDEERFNGFVKANKDKL